MGTMMFNETWLTKGPRMFGAHEEGGLIKAHAPLFFNCFLLQGNCKSTKQTTQDLMNQKEKYRKPLKGPWLMCYAKGKP